MARLQTESETPNTAALIPGIGAAESELREALRLEELERRTRSLRALPVAQSYRDPNAAAESSEAGTGDAADADVAVLENAVQAALASFEQSLGALEGELAAEQLLLGSPGIAAAAAPASGQQASRPAPGPVQPSRSVRPADPPGWERIYEGSFLEAVLLTQLTGDFPGPVLATVSVPVLFGRPPADPDPARRTRRRHSPGRSKIRTRAGSPSRSTGCSYPTGAGSTSSSRA